MNNNSITIVTVTYNAEKTIERTILSVLSQKNVSLQYVIIDGGSSDNTLGIINRYRNQISVVVSEKDGGVYDAMNKSLRFVTKKWVLFLNSGDTFFSSSVIKSIFSFNISNANIIYGDTFYQYKKRGLYIKARPLEVLKNEMPFCHQSVLVRTELLRLNPFDLSYKLAADYNLFFSLFKNGYNFMYIPVCISNYSLSEGLTDSNTLLLHKELIKIRGGHLRFKDVLMFGYCFIRDRLPLRVKELFRYLAFK